MKHYRHLRLRDSNQQFSAPLSAKNPKPPHRGLSHHESPPSSRRENPWETSFPTKWKQRPALRSSGSGQSPSAAQSSSYRRPLPYETSPPQNKRSLGSGLPPLSPAVQNRVTKISVTDFFSVFTPISQRFFRCSICGNRVKSQIPYLILHTFACRNAICEHFLKEPAVRQRLMEILSEIRQVQEVERNRVSLHGVEKH